MIENWDKHYMWIIIKHIFIVIVTEQIWRFVLRKRKKIYKLLWINFIMWNYSVVQIIWMWFKSWERWILRKLKTQEYIECIHPDSQPNSHKLHTQFTQIFANSELELDFHMLLFIPYISFQHTHTYIHTNKDTHPDNIKYLLPFHVFHLPNDRLYYL